MVKKFFRYLHRKHIVWLFLTIMACVVASLAYVIVQYGIIDGNRPTPNINPKPDPNPKPKPDPKPWEFEIKASDVEYSIEYQDGAYWYDENMLMYFISKKLIKTVLIDDVSYVSYLFSDSGHANLTNQAEVVFYNDQNILRKDIILTLKNNV